MLAEQNSRPIDVMSAFKCAMNEALILVGKTITEVAQDCKNEIEKHHQNLKIL